VLVSGGRDTARRGGKPIVHGGLLMGFGAKVLGVDCPGDGSVAVGISARFLRPVPVGAEIRCEGRVSEKIEKYKHIKCRVYVYIGKKTALGGEATLIPPSPESDD